jgi:hypothetical protein
LDLHTGEKSMNPVGVRVAPPSSNASGAFTGAESCRPVAQGVEHQVKPEVELAPGNLPPRGVFVRGGFAVHRDACEAL